MTRKKKFTSAFSKISKNFNNRKRLFEMQNILNFLWNLMTLTRALVYRLEFTSNTSALRAQNVAPKKVIFGHPNPNEFSYFGWNLPRPSKHNPFCCWHFCQCLNCLGSFFYSFCAITISCSCHTKNTLEFSKQLHNFFHVSLVFDSWHIFWFSWHLYTLSNEKWAQSNWNEWN